MQVPLRPFLFFALLTTGACLNCETCNITGTTCTGELKECSKGENVCVLVVSETVEDGKAEHNVFKGCDNVEACSNPTMQFTVGNKTSYRASLTCCIEPNCTKTPLPELPPKNSNPNGVKCLGCLSENKECKSETLVCTGQENFCFEVTATLQDKGKQITRIMKGCTTQSVCSSIKTGHSPMLDYDKVEVATCDPIISRGFRSTGLLLPLFTGLLLLKIAL